MPNPRLFDRSVIRLSPTETGEDVRGFLQGLVTQDTAAELPLWAGLLSPQGKALFDFFLWSDPSTGSGLSDILIDCEGSQAEALARRLSMYRLRRKIAIVRDDALGVFWSTTPPVRPELVEGQVAKHIGGSASLAFGSTGSARTDLGDDPRHPELGHRWLAPISPDDEDVGDAFRTHRLSLGITEGIAELGSDQTLWLETNAAELHGVSFNKGCYVGQENTARMNWRQKVNRRLVVVPLTQADPKRQRIAYPELGISVEHRRVEDMSALNLPDWQRAAIS